MTGRRFVLVDWSALYENKTADVYECVTLVENLIDHQFC